MQWSAIFAGVLTSFLARFVMGVGVGALIGLSGGQSTGDLIVVVSLIGDVIVYGFAGIVTAKVARDSKQVSALIVGIVAMVLMILVGLQGWEYNSKKAI